MDFCGGPLDRKCEGQLGNTGVTGGFRWDFWRVGIGDHAGELNDGGCKQHSGTILRIRMEMIMGSC